jgi:FixJ family two-component response regulator
VLAKFNNHQENPLICIVDDDKAARESLQALIRSLGYSTVVFGSAEEFLSSGFHHTATCLLSDVQMPGVSGLELQSLLTAIGFDIPIIFLTGHEAERARALRAGAIAFLTKPVDQDTLVDCLLVAIDHATTKSAAKYSAKQSTPAFRRVASA